MVNFDFVYEPLEFSVKRVGKIRVKMKHQWSQIESRHASREVQEGRCVERENILHRCLPENRAQSV